MRFHVLCGDIRIASFTNEVDRDLFIDLMEDRHHDCLFQPEDD